MASVQSNMAMDTYPMQAQPLVKAGLRSQVLLFDDPLYDARIDSYWCNNAKLRPACIFTPDSAAEVAKGISALVQADQPFAVRSGGHMNWAGSNNITDGVTIDLGHLNKIEYDSTTETVNLGTGAKWKHVYAELEKHQRTVVGAREAEVGVGGFLLGGGNTFLTPSHGFACDNVVQYEVVLADGRIVTAKAGGETSDLFRVLKGGGNNFGIVTRFMMRTLPNSAVWGGLSLQPLDVIPDAAEALARFTAESSSDTDSNLQFVVGHQPRFGGGVAITLCNNMAAIERPRALEGILGLPELMNNFKTTTLQEILTYSSLPADYYNTWFTLTFRNDPAIVRKASELHNELAKELQKKIVDEDFTSHVAFQPLPRLFVERSHVVNSSGNILGLEQNRCDGIIMQASVSVRTVELEQWARPKVRALVESVREFASTIENGVIPWLYLNYAHPSQEVLQSYGPENVNRMRETAKAYDPHKVFQRLCPGGFKIADL